MPKRAILAGGGALPQSLLEAGDAILVTFHGTPVDARASQQIEARFEQLASLFARLKSEGVTELCLAGAMRRPVFEPTALDAGTAALMPRLMAALQQGDDGLLRAVIALLEEQGFTICAPHDIRPDLLASEGVMVGEVSAALHGDAHRAAAVLAALAPQDVGQGAVVAKGQVLAIETLPGTDAMLEFVAQTCPNSGGVLMKRPKAGQDLRVDMPGIGPQTIAMMQKAGLSGLVVQAGGALILERAEVLARAASAGITLWAAP